MLYPHSALKSSYLSTDEAGGQGAKGVWVYWLNGDVQSAIICLAVHMNIVLTYNVTSWKWMLRKSFFSLTQADALLALIEACWK